MYLNEIVIFNGNLYIGINSLNNTIGPYMFIFPIIYYFFCKINNSYKTKYISNLYGVYIGKKNNVTSLETDLID